MELKICHLYHDILNLYGDTGNIICMKHRLNSRGIDAPVTRVGVGEHVSLSDFDVVFIGGGQDFEQEVLLPDLRAGKADEIKAAVKDGVTFLTICGGYQMMGSYYETHEGVKCDFIGAADYYTIGSKTRMIGNFAFRATPECSDSDVVGFENHSGKTYLSAGLPPLGTVISGYGNNGEDGTEGVHFSNVFGSYSHGPLLPKNPALCDCILLTALERKYGVKQLQQLDDSLEISAHYSVLSRLKK